MADLFIKEDTLQAIVDAIDNYGVGYMSGPASEFIAKIQNMGGPTLYGHYTVRSASWLCSSTEPDITLSIETAEGVKLYFNDQEVWNLTSIVLGYSTLNFIGSTTCSFNMSTEKWIGGTPREIVFTEPTVVSSEFYNRFQQIVDSELPSYLSAVDQESAILEGTISTFYGDITAVRSFAFYQCSNLSQVNLPNALEIGSNAFCICTSLASVNAPQVTQLGMSAFAGCTNLTNIKLSSACFTIPAYCFTSTKISSVPGAPSLIAPWAFGNCTSLSSYRTNTVSVIGSNAFNGAKKLNYLSIPNCTSIGICALLGTGLTAFEFPSKITIIPSGVLSSCASLTTVKVGASCSTIQRLAFANCTKLTTLDLTNATTSLIKLESTDAFNNCTSLSKIRVPSFMIASYKQASNWKSFSSIIGSS